MIGNRSAPPPMPPQRTSHFAVADLLDILPDAVLMVDARGRICYVNPAVHTILGYAAEEILDQPLSLLIPKEARERHEAMVERFRADGPPTMMGSRPVLHAVHRSGRVVPVSISLTNLTLGDGERVTVAVIHDVTTLNTELDRATAQAETDALTGLGNRLRLARRGRALLMNQRPFSLLYLDLQRFKALNDRLGHGAGDHALRVMARRLQTHVRDADLAARVGGDEFVVLLDGVDAAERLEARAQVIAVALTQPFRVEDVTDALSVNIGGAISQRHGRTLDALLAAADQAMYAAKQAQQVYRLAEG